MSEQSASYTSPVFTMFLGMVICSSHDSGGRGKQWSCNKPLVLLHAHVHCQLQAKLEEVKQWAWTLELGNRQLSEQLNKLSGLNADGNALVKELKAQVKKLEQEKESLKNEIQIAKTAVRMYIPV